MSFNQTAALVPEIGLDYVLRELVPANYSIDRMLTTFPNTIKRLSQVLRSTTKQTMQAFFVWQTTVAFSNGIEADEIRPYKEFLNRLNGRASYPKSPEGLSVHPSLPQQWPRQTGGWGITRKSESTCVLT